MGYSQLWILQKVQALAPSQNRKVAQVAHRLDFPDFEAGVIRDDFANLFHVFKEPTSTVQYNDHLGARRHLDAALAFAQDAANQLGCRVVVARLVHDWTWH
jgi:hypothetical protein